MCPLAPAGDLLGDPMTLSAKEIAGRDLSPKRFQRGVVEGCQPVILRGLLAEWPVVQAGLGSATRGARPWSSTPHCLPHRLHTGSATSSAWRERGDVYRLFGMVKRREINRVRDRPVPARRQ